MTRKLDTLGIALLLIAGLCDRSYGQALPTSILEIEVENEAQYVGDVSDVSKFATNPNATTPINPANFAQNVVIADIVTVNGRPAKGIYVRTARRLGLTTAPSGGQGIADTVRDALIEDAFEILTSDGRPIGTIVSLGLAGGAPPPGAPLAITQANFAIVGGTGAFLGMRGQWGQAVTPQTVAARAASIAESPANRRRNAAGQGRRLYVLQLIPTIRPEIMMTAGGPLITHADSTIVSAAHPAVAGETLSLFVTGLGPTRIAVDPGQPFPSSSLAEVNALVQVTVNGRSADVLSAVGYPGQVDTYQVNVRVPAGVGGGPARLQVTAAWVGGPAVTIPVQ